MRLFALVFALAALSPAQAGAQATLNKCTDAQGRVTYSNLPCPKSKTAQQIDIDPAPPAPPPAAKAAPEKRAPARRAPADTPAQLELEPGRTPAKPAARGSTRQCDTLTEQLGRVLDKMDHARRHGYTLQEMDRWNLEARELERKKQQAGCF
jgi:hypothetical protein